MRTITNTTSAFATRLMELMMITGATESAVGCLINVPSQKVSEYLEDRAVPSCENVCVLARTFGVTTDYLLGMDAEQGRKETVNNDVTIGNVHYQFSFRQ